MASRASDKVIARIKEIVEWHERQDKLKEVQIKFTGARDGSGIYLLHTLGKGGELKEDFFSTFSKHPEYKPMAWLFSNLSRITSPAQSLAREKNLFWKFTGKNSYILGSTTHLFGKTPSGLRNVSPMRRSLKKK